MKTSRFTLRTLAIAMFMLAATSFAQAQATRTWVSGVGDDVNPCSRTAPCKTYAGAISKTATGGEISVLDPGGYGTLTITKAITVDGGTGAGWGSTLAAGLSGFTINITTGLSTDKVTLRNLSINGNNTAGGFDGIRFLAGVVLNVENCVIFNFSGDGIDMNKTAAGELYVRDTTINNCAGAGIKAFTSAAQNIVDLNNVKVHDCGTGADLQNGSRGVVRNCAMTGNTTGLSVSQTTLVTEVNVRDCSFAFGTTGISAPSGTVRISDNFITQNSTGVSATGTGQILTFGNNNIGGNTANGATTGPVPGAVN